MLSERANLEQRFIRCDYQQDQWGRDSLATVLTVDGSPDVTYDGIHQIEFHYLENGILSTKTYYDINKNIIRPKEQ